MWVIRPSVWFDCTRPGRTATRSKSASTRSPLDQFLNTRLGRNTRGDPVTRWTAADGGMHVLAVLLHDTLQRGDFGSTDTSYADFLARALSDRGAWPRDPGARYRELTGTDA